jgi:hypothetical protein
VEARDRVPRSRDLVEEESQERIGHHPAGKPSWLRDTDPLDAFNPRSRGSCRLSGRLVRTGGSRTQTARRTAGADEASRLPAGENL